MEPDMVGPGDEQDKARIRENVAKMQAKGAPDAEIESYLRDVEGLKPVAQEREHPAGYQDPETIRALNAQDREDAVGPLGAVGHGIRYLASSAPFGIGKRLLAYGKSKDEGTSYDEALKNVEAERRAFADEHGIAAPALNVTANALAFRGIPGKIGGLSSRATNTVVGGATAAGERALSTEHPNETLADKAWGTVGAGLGGSLVGRYLPAFLAHPVGRAVTGGVVGGVAGRAMADDDHKTEGTIAGVGGGAAAGLYAPQLASFLGEKIGNTRLGQSLAALGEASGTRGAVNQDLAAQDRLLKATGLPGVGFKTNVAQNDLARSQKFYDQSKKLFSAAKADPTVLNDKEIVGLIADPDVQGAFKAASRIRSASGNPVPSVPVSPEQAIRPTGFETFGESGPEMMDVPDPSALHLTKRILRDVVQRGFDKDSPIPLEDALRIQPKLERLTALLHNRSRDYAMADRFFQAGKVAEEGGQIAYGAVKPGMRNPSAGALGERDVAGARQFIADQPTPRLQAVASGAVRRGALGQMQQQLASRDVRGGIEGLLKSPILGVGGPQVEQRALALGSNADDYSRLVGELEDASNKSAANGALAHAYGHVRFGPIVANTNGGTSGVMGRAGAAPILRRMEADPAAYQHTLSSYERGKSLLEALRNALSAQTGVAIGGRQ